MVGEDTRTRAPYERRNIRCKSTPIIAQEGPVFHKNPEQSHQPNQRVPGHGPDGFKGAGGAFGTRQPHSHQFYLPHPIGRFHHAGRKKTLHFLARRVHRLDRKMAELLDDHGQLTQQACPGLRQTYCIGTNGAAKLFVTLGDKPERLRSNAAFASLCGVSPLTASPARLTVIASIAEVTARPRQRSTPRLRTPTLARGKRGLCGEAIESRAQQNRDHSLSQTVPRTGSIPYPSSPPTGANRFRMSHSVQPVSRKGDHRLLHGAAVALAIRSLKQTLML